MLYATYSTKKKKKEKKIIKMLSCSVVFQSIETQKQRATFILKGIKPI